MNCRFCVLSACLGLAALAGCSGGAKVDPAEVARQRTRLTLAEEPDGAQTVLDIRAVMFGEDPAALHAELEHEHAEEHAEHTEETADAEHTEEGHGHAKEEHEHAGEEHEHVALDPDAKPKLAEMDVVLVGTVGGVPNPTTQSHPEFPFAKGEAMFFLSDPEAAAEFAEHGHQHAPGEECAFCAAHAADAAALLAVVQFHDEKGKLLSVDARELFDLKEKETVVVRGKARIVPGGMLAVEATGLYVRR
jgi:hypothetical protein